MDIAPRPRPANRRGPAPRGGAAIASLALLGLASCSSTQLWQSDVSSTVVQILGIALVVWLVLLIV